MRKQLSPRKIQSCNGEKNLPIIEELLAAVFSDDINENQYREILFKLIGTKFTLIEQYDMDQLRVAFESRYSIRNEQNFPVFTKIDELQAKVSSFLANMPKQILNITAGVEIEIITEIPGNNDPYGFVILPMLDSKPLSEVIGKNFKPLNTALVRKKLFSNKYNEFTYDNWSPNLNDFGILEVITASQFTKDLNSLIESLNNLQHITKVLEMYCQSDSKPVFSVLEFVMYYNNFLLKNNLEPEKFPSLEIGEALVYDHYKVDIYFKKVTDRILFKYIPQLTFTIPLNTVHIFFKEYAIKLKTNSYPSNKQQGIIEESYLRNENIWTQREVERLLIHLSHLITIKIVNKSSADFDVFNNFIFLILYRIFIPFYFDKQSLYTTKNLLCNSGAFPPADEKDHYEFYLKTTLKKLYLHALTQNQREILSKFNHKTLIKTILSVSKPEIINKLEQIMNHQNPIVQMWKKSLIKLNTESINRIQRGSDLLTIIETTDISKVCASEISEAASKQPNFPHYKADGAGAVLIFHTETGAYVLGGIRSNPALNEKLTKDSTAFPMQINTTTGGYLPNPSSSLKEGILNAVKSKLFSKTELTENEKGFEAQQALKNLLQTIGNTEGWEEKICVHTDQWKEKDTEKTMCYLTAIKHIACSDEDITKIDNALQTMMGIKKSEGVNLAFKFVALQPIIENSLSTYQANEITKATEAYNKHGNQVVVTFNDLAVATLAINNAFKIVNFAQLTLPSDTLSEKITSQN